MDGMNQVKVFTVEEADQLLPHLTDLLEELQEKREELIRQEVEIDATELIAPTDESGFHPAMDKELNQYNRTMNRFYQIVDEIHETGCFLKDVDMGLIDFFSLQEGRVVYLCWRLGEPGIKFWHEVGLGYAHRQPLESGPPS